MDSHATSLVEQVRDAAAQRRPLRIRGGDTKAFYGRAVQGETLDTRAYHGIIDYAPAELVVTVRAGTPLALLEAQLAQCGQMLAFEPPHVGAAATVGGMVAAGLAGPRRMAQGVATGGVRDSVLGVRLIDGRGEILSVGGRVVKNVAGYDVSRLMVGAQGTLGVLLDLSLRVAPIPPTEVTLQCACTVEEALRRMQRWRAMPWPISATAYWNGVLSVRLSGSTLAVEEAVAHLEAERVAADVATVFWRDVREWRFAEAADLPLWRIGLPASVGPLPLPGQTLIEWSGQRRWCLSDASPAEIRQIAQSHGGHATRFRGDADGVSPFPPVAPVVQAWERRLREAFDPLGILNPGRMHADAPR